MLLSESYKKRIQELAGLVNEATNFEIGDREFPLVIDKKKDITRHHKLIGKKAIINDNAKESLKDKHGSETTIKGVVIKNKQVAGLEVDLSGKTYYAPIKDFDIAKKPSFSEDVYLHSEDSIKIRKQLSHWNGQRDYMGLEWDGVEKFNFELAKIIDSVAIESAGWYKYDSSKRGDMDGKDWRLVTTNTDSTVSINCHSILHDNVWSLSTTIFDTKEIKKGSLKSISDEDVWKRSIKWSIKTAEVLSTDGYNYDSVIADMKNRLKEVNKLQKIKDEIVKDIKNKFSRNFREKRALPKEITIGISKWGVTSGKIATYYSPKGERKFGIIMVNPKALGDDKYLKQIIMHELIHASFGQSCGRNAHHDNFNKLADMIGLEKKYRK